MKYEAFNHTVDEYATELTAQAHQTVYWLHTHGYLDNKQTEDLVSRMIVTPVRNNPKFGERLLARFFGKESPENSYVFPITLLDDNLEHRPRKNKPKLEVVE